MTVATTEAHGLALATEQDWWTDKQLAALRQIGVDRASNGDLAVFMHVCQRTGLDPFARQIYMILRDGKQVIQTGIDGMRLVARRAVDRTGEALSISAPEWCGPDGQWTDVWLSSEPPAAARTTVRRGNGTFAAVALWSEYVQRKRDGDVTRMWATRGAGQLAKCSEALALRKACPQDLSGVYSEDEIAREPAPAERRGGLRTVLAEQEQPNEPVRLDTRGDLAQQMYDAIGALGIADNERLPFIMSVIDRPIGSTKDMTEDEARAVLAHIDEINEPLDAELVEDGDA